MKKVLTILASLSLVLSLAGCSKKKSEEVIVPKMSAIEVLNEVFKQNDLETFGIIEFMNEQELEEVLTKDETNKADFSEVKEALIARPMAMSVARVAVVELKDTASDTELELMKNFRFQSGCIVPEEKDTHISKRDNYLIYTFDVEKEEDLGQKLIDSFNTMSLAKYDYENPSFFEIGMNQYKENKDKFSSINTNTIQMLIGRDLGLPRNLSEAVNKSMILTGNIEIKDRKNYVDNITIYLEANPDSKQELLEFLKSQVEKGTIARYVAENLNITEEENYIIITNC